MEKQLFNGTGVAEVELVYRSKIKASQQPQITSSSGAYRILLQLWNEDTLDLQ